jgi:hypothetical protein
MMSKSQPRPAALDDLSSSLLEIFAASPLMAPDRRPDYDAMALAVRVLDRAAGSPVHSGDLKELAARLEALGVQW